MFCLDWEDAPHRKDAASHPDRSKTMTAEQAKQFCEYVYMVTGQRPVIYSGNTAKRILKDDKDEFFGQHRLWLASYTETYDVQASWDDYWLWQFQGDNLGPNQPRKIAGVKGTGIDLNTSDPAKTVAEWTGGRPNKPNTGELPEVKETKPSIGIDDALVVGGGAGVLTQTDLLTGVVVVLILVGIFVWWKYFRKK